VFDLQGILDMTVTVGDFKQQKKAGVYRIVTALEKMKEKNA